MIDRETRSFWTHLEGKSYRGDLEGERLEIIPVPQMPWGEWKRYHPDTLVLSPDTPYSVFYRSMEIGFLDRDEPFYDDHRLAPNDLVVGVEVNEQFKGYPVGAVQGSGGVVNDVLGGEPIVVVYHSQVITGLAYSRVVNGRTLEFYNSSDQGFEMRDRSTGSEWDPEGQAIAGPLSGTSLKYVTSFISEWYGWSAYHPETDLFQLVP